MANVTDSASLLTIPSGWDDGVLGSLKPDDGTGDFTFSRGANLSATRVNEDGYIERGYENLLLQSNNFNVSPWLITNSDPLSGYPGYDGTNDAWQLNAVGTGSYRRIRQVLSNTGVYTFSIYAKANTTNFIVLWDTNGSNRTYFDLSQTNPENVVSLQQGGIDGSPKAESVGNGWWKVSMSFNRAGTGEFWIFPVDESGNTLCTDGNGVYIQDAMAVQGFSDMPYIESTTTTAKAGISEDQPRIDYSNNTNGKILLEPQKTNDITSLVANAFNGATWDISETTIGNGMLLPHYYCYATSQYAGHITNTPIAAGEVRSFSIFFKPISASSGYHRIGLYFNGQSNFIVYDYARDGFYADTNGTALPSNSYVESYPNDVYKIVSIQTASSAYTRYDVNIDSYYNTSSQFLFGYAQVELGLPTSYIPTYGTSTTRLKETATLTKNVASTGTIYINIEAQKSRTLTFLGANISVTAGTNKIAMSYSPTALKVSHNGSIVANTPRTFDTASLTQIQLGHRNNFEQTTDGINQFLTLDSFLSDADLNALTI